MIAPGFAAFLPHRALSSAKLGNGKKHSGVIGDEGTLELLRVY
jgi:hypothetical protein